MKKHAFNLLALLLMLSLTALFSGCAFSDKDFEEEADGDTDHAVDGDGEHKPLELTTVNAPGNWNPTAARTPVDIHITWEHNPADAATLQWQTEEKGEKGYVPKIWLARAIDIEDADPALYEQDVEMPYTEVLTAEGMGSAYCQKLMCSSSSMEGWQWTVEISDLEPDTVYYYRVGTWESFDKESGEFTKADLSPVYHFRTGLPKGSQQPFVFGFGSDSQNWKDKTFDRMKEIRVGTGKDARFWLFGGDLTEAGSQLELWGWFDALAPILHYNPFMPVRGNHDIIEGALYGEFALPQMPNLPKEYNEAAWSFNYGNMHVLAFYSNGEGFVKSQLTFIEKDLKAASEDPDIDWIVGVYHHPMYSSASAHGTTDYLVSLVAPLFDKYRVDITFSGHDHDYERTKPMRNGEIKKDGEGTVYIVSGGFYSKKSYGNGTSDFTAKSVDGESKSYVILTVDGKKLSGVAYSGDHSVLDTFELNK